MPSAAISPVVSVTSVHVTIVVDTIATIAVSTIAVASVDWRPADTTVRAADHGNVLNV
jgi:hypothetical protein